MNNGIVKNWMTSPVITVSPETKLTEARRILDDHKIRALPVIKDDELVGIVTRRGLLRLDLSQLDLHAWQNMVTLDEAIVNEIMSTKPLTVVPASRVPKAARVMLENKITALPVLENKKLVGILTNSDLMRVIVEEFPTLKRKVIVEHLMTEEVVSIDEDTSLLEAHRLMGTMRIRSLPVMRENQMVGLVTRTDLMSSDISRLAARNNQEVSLKILTQSVEQIMTRDLITIRADALVTDAAQLMINYKIHCLPVVDAEGKLAGIITESDLFLLIVQKFF